MLCEGEGQESWVVEKPWRCFIFCGWGFGWEDCCFKDLEKLGFDGQHFAFLGRSVSSLQWRFCTVVLQRDVRWLEERFLASETTFKKEFYYYSIPHYFCAF